jgi:AcrR family transcriptional regulator
MAATLDDVARHAGLGVGTVYRRFANKEELVDAVFTDIIDTVDELGQVAAAEPDAWHGLAASLEKVCELQAFDRGLREVMLGTGPGPQRMAEVGARLGPTLSRLVARAKEQGSLRADVHEGDVLMIQLMVAAVTDRTGRPDLWRRYLRLVLDGMRAEPGAATELPVAGISPRDLMRDSQ